MMKDDAQYTNSTFASRYMTEPIPKLDLPAKGLPAPIVSQVIKDMRALDAHPNLNLASFVTTWMEPEARALVDDSVNVNFVNADEYPSCTEMGNRCLSMIARLMHSPSRDDPVGAPCVGSSEAIMLGGLAMKKRWQAFRKEAGKDTGAPNLVMSTATHVCWEKFCRYWDVEPRYVQAEETRLAATPEMLAAKCDENTIGVVAILGTTYTGEFEDVAGLDALVSKMNKANGWRVVVHVDAASGGFVVPFVYPAMKWDFRLPNVASINLSGHKYGLVYPGIGWAVWRDASFLPESMVFYADYLGSVERTITLNFSRGASQIVAQYYQFLRLGVEGYTKIMNNLTGISAHIRQKIQKSKHFEVLSKKEGIPLVAFRLVKKKRLYDETDISERVRMAGWWIPAYSMPHGAEQHKMMRITIREDLSLDMADEVLAALEKAVEWLEKDRSVKNNRYVDIK